MARAGCAILFGFWLHTKEEDRGKIHNKNSFS